MVPFLQSFRNFTITELTTEHATELLMVTSDLSNRTLAAAIASLVGNVPLALQVVGKILSERSVESVIKQLQTDRISTFTGSKDLPVTDHVVASLNISYGFLTPENQKCAKLLAIFPGSFDETIPILNGTDIAVSECLSTLRYKSLLDIDRGTDCYRFHRRVKVFFMSQIRREEQEQFSDQFAIYYRYYQASKLAVEHKPGSTSNSGKAIFSHTVPQKYTSLSGSYNALDIFNTESMPTAIEEKLIDISAPTLPCKVHHNVKLVLLILAKGPIIIASSKYDCATDVFAL